MPPHVNSYAFGDGDRAARRLELVAKVFHDPSHAFLRRAVPAAPALAVDLGCGPGHTTRLLHEATASARTVGIDSSEHFLAMASRTGGAGIAFARHDVRSVPFPAGPADVIYSRLLLAHLPEPAALVNRWVTQLRPGGDPGAGRGRIHPHHQPGTGALRADGGRAHRSARGSHVRGTGPRGHDQRICRAATAWRRSQESSSSFPDANAGRESVGSFEAHQDRKDSPNAHD